MMISPETKRLLLVNECKKWIGIKEVGGDNKGQMVERWQKAIDQKASQEAWCMAFVMSMIIDIDKLCLNVFADTQMSSINKSEHCLTVWNTAPSRLKFQTPLPGYIAIWQHGNTTLGHAGIVVEGMNHNYEFKTVEGNTGDGSGVIREGDGVYLRTRSLKSQGAMKLLGFLSVW
jgi:hypothetical protein